MNRRGMFAKIAAAALGAVAAKVGLNLTPLVPHSHGFGLVGGVNVLDGGTGRFDTAEWRRKFDEWSAQLDRRHMARYGTPPTWRHYSA